MPCTSRRITVVQKTAQQKAIEQLEQDLVTGSAAITTDMFGNVVVTAPTKPEGMMDLCILAMLQQRNSLGFQLAVGAAGLQNQNFVGQHNAAHAVLGKSSH